MAKNNENERKPIQFYVSEEEYNEIEEYRKIAGTTKSEFIRQAIMDKIMRIKTPELFKQKATLNGESKANLKNVLSTVFDNQEKINLLIEKMDLMLNIQNGLKVLANQVEKDGLKELEIELDKILPKNKVMKVGEIAKKMNLKKDEVLKILSNNSKYSLDIATGGFKRNE